MLDSAHHHLGNDGRYLGPPRGQHAGREDHHVVPHDSRRHARPLLHLISVRGVPARPVRCFSRGSCPGPPLAAAREGGRVGGAVGCERGRRRGWGSSTPAKGGFVCSWQRVRSAGVEPMLLPPLLQPLLLPRWSSTKRPTIKHKNSTHHSAFGYTVNNNVGATLCYLGDRAIGQLTPEGDGAAGHHLRCTSYGCSPAKAPELVPKT